MTNSDLPARPKSRRILSRMNNSKQRQFELYKQQARNITSPVELLPGLNDISDAFEALPLDLIKYFTLLKEIDAKCINAVPLINQSIKSYINQLHDTPTTDSNDNSSQSNGKQVDNTLKTKKVARLSNIRNKLHEIIPYLEEKMHVTTVATDLLHKHMFRINNDYKLIIQNNEIPELIRIGPLNHPAMIMDLSGPLDGSNPNRSAQLARSESRREALAARKANKDDDEEIAPVSGPGKKRKGAVRGGASDGSAAVVLGSESGVNGASSTGRGTNGPLVGRGTNSGAGSAAKKRQRKDNDVDSARFSTAGGNGVGGPSANISTTVSHSSSTTAVNSANNATKKRSTKPKREDDTSVPPGALLPGSEPTYCYCNQVSFGEMVGCDGDDCKREWFHLPCIGFKNPPKGKWYCDDCLAKMKKRKV